MDPIGPIDRIDRIDPIWVIAVVLVVLRAAGLVTATRCPPAHKTRKVCLHDSYGRRICVHTPRAVQGQLSELARRVLV